MHAIPLLGTELARPQQQLLLDMVLDEGKATRSAVKPESVNRFYAAFAASMTASENQVPSDESARHANAAATCETVIKFYSMIEDLH